jgi:predicted DNA-binding antitoxin AbrB/MazE fold protein
MLECVERNFYSLPGSLMSLTVEAVYENGVLKLLQPVALPEHEHVQVTIHPKTGWVQETAGILGFKGDPEELRRLAVHPESDLEDEP